MPPDYLDYEFLDAVDGRMEEGYATHPENAWRPDDGTPVPYSVTQLTAKLRRHLVACEFGQSDEDHAAAIGCNAMMLWRLLADGSKPVEPTNE